MVNIISISSVPLKCQLYNRVKLNILTGLIMFICKTIQSSCYLALLQTAGSPQETGFPSTSGQNSGTFGATIRWALRGWGKLTPIRSKWTDQFRPIRS